MNLHDARRSFLDYQSMAQGIAPSSAKLYASILGGLERFVGPNATMDAAGVRLEAFLIARARSGLGDHARRKTFEVTRLFYRWAAERGHARANPLRDARPPRVQDRPGSVITKDEALGLIAAAKASGRLHAERDAAIFATMFYAGLRVGECCRLRVSEADLEAGTLAVYGKGGKLRVVPIHRALAGILRAWLKQRPDGSELMFPSRAAGWARTGQLDPCRIERALRDHYAPAARLAGRVEPHTLRRTFATELYRRGVPVRHIQRLLGHSDERTTRRYLNLADEELAGSVGKL